MSSFGAAVVTPELRALSPRSASEPVGLTDGADGGTRSRVLAWSGPDGWRTTKPCLSVKARQNSCGGDEGFSLIELLVALLVLGILLAVAIPTFLGTTGAADDRSAQSNLITAFTAAKAQFQNENQTYDVNGASDSAAFASAVEAQQLQMTFKAGSLGSSVTQGSSASLSDISVAVSSDGIGLVLAAYSVPGNCFYVVDNTGPLSASASATNPYVGSKSVTTGNQSMSGAIGLPISEGTAYVSVAGDTDKGDCNAFRPKASILGVSARYQTSGFPS